MKKMFVDFGHSFKNYFDCIMKVGFGELILRFFEFALIILFSLAMYIPVELVKGLLFDFIKVFIPNNSDIFINVYNLIFSIVSFVICIRFFIYLFTKRYEKMIEISIKEEDNKKDKIDIIKDDKEEMDLPKMKDE